MLLEKRLFYQHCATIYKQCESLIGKQENFMKTVLILSLTFLFVGSSFSQKMDDRFLTKYSLEEIKSIKEKTPEVFNLLTYALDNAMYITGFPSEKNLELTSIEMPVKGATFLDLGLEILQENQYFKIQGTEKMLVMKSEWVLNHELKTK